ncbi:MAG: hypothetical protein IKM54_03025, partial [Butyricicoccus sp.]|nr:hypothetical protein [Butyricicoccus sp.]
MSHWKKILGPPLAAILLLYLFLFACIVYRTDYAATEVLTSAPEVLASASDDGQYSLTVSMIGEPDWPFGPTHCRFDLEKYGKRILRHSFSVRNDGASVSENNFTVVWNPDSVSVLVTGEEQPEDTYIL